MADRTPVDGETLVFVYKADSGLFNTLTDMAHKALSPSTYSCRLCALTHGPFRMHRRWKTFVSGLPLPCEFLHRDELEQRYGIREERLPVVYRRRGEELQPCLGAAAIEACAGIGELEDALERSCVGAIAPRSAPDPT